MMARASSSAGWPSVSIRSSVTWSIGDSVPAVPSLLRESRLAVGVAVDLRAVDQGVLDAAQHVQRITGPDDEVGVFTWLDGAEPVIDPDDPCRVDGERAQGSVTVEAVLD